MRSLGVSANSNLTRQSIPKPKNGNTVRLLSFMVGHASKIVSLEFSQFSLGTRVYQGGSFEYSLLSPLHTPSVTNLMEPGKELQGWPLECLFSHRYSPGSFPHLVESVYYALIKTGNDGCSKDCHPKLSLYGSEQQNCTTIELKSLSNVHSLEKGQLDLFQWKDENIGHIERMQLAAVKKQKSSKSSWQIEWILVIHHGYTFTGP